MSDQNGLVGTKDEMNHGVQNLGLGQGDAPLPVPPGGIHRAAQPESSNVEDVMTRHPAYAQATHLSEDMSAAIDTRFESESPIFAGAQATQISFRWRGPSAGELLGWIYVGSITREEARVDHSCAAACNLLWLLWAMRYSTKRQCSGFDERMMRVRGRKLRV